MEQWDNKRTMKDRDASRHPGPFRIMQVDSEIAGLLVAVGFLVMGFVSMPIATGFVLGAVALGVIVALLLRFTPKNFRRLVLGSVIIFVVVALFWEGWKPRRPRRPPTVSSDALYVLPDNVPSTLQKTGSWVDCWFDEHANVDRCKLADEKGTVSFEDVFLPCIGKEPLHQSVFVFNGRRLWTAYIWNRSPEKGTKVPVVFVNGQVLLPRSFYAEAKRDVYCPPI
jgi:hypothetical protein